MKQRDCDHAREARNNSLAIAAAVFTLSAMVLLAMAIVGEWGPTPVQKFAHRPFFWFDVEAWILLLQSLMWLVSTVMAGAAVIYAVVVVIKWRKHAARA